MTRRNLLICSLTATFALLGCAEMKQAGKEIGHATRDATTAVGHATRDTTKAIGHASRDAVISIHDELSQ
ncbi:hypothetical protein ACF8PD_00145 [Vibrio plantisponsor]|uniref:hypothetical protein n=1 Tax=Vibrio plantisponsor TaxID=664643 RepID=UPI00370C1B45